MGQSLERCTALGIFTAKLPTLAKRTRHKNHIFSEKGALHLENVNAKSETQVTPMLLTLYFLHYLLNVSSYFIVAEMRPLSVK